MNPADYEAMNEALLDLMAKLHTLVMDQDLPPSTRKNALTAIGKADLVCLDLRSMQRRDLKERLAKGDAGGPGGAA